MREIVSLRFDVSREPSSSRSVTQRAAEDMLLGGFIIIHTANLFNEICRFTDQVRVARCKLVIGIANRSLLLLEIPGAPRYREENLNDTLRQGSPRFSEKTAQLLFTCLGSPIGGVAVIKV